MRKRLKMGRELTGESVKKKKTTYRTFDAAADLDNDTVIAEYLSAAAEDPNPEVFVAALGDRTIQLRVIPRSDPAANL